MVEDDHSKELKQWLTSCGCQNYYNRFVENGITLALVPELDSAALKEIGVSVLGDRLRIEIAISNMKAKAYTDSFITNKELQELINLNLLDDDSTSNLDHANNGVYSSFSNGDSTTLIHHNAVANNSQPSVVTPATTPGATSSSHLPLGGSGNNANTGLETNKNVTFIFQDGTSKKVNITGCFNAQSIKRKALKKVGIKEKDILYDAYIQNQNNVSRLFDVELVTICYSPDRQEKNRIILCAKDEVPSEQALETSKKIIQKQDKFDKNHRVNDKDLLSQFHIPELKKVTPPTLRNFFGQRPPSELISSNLAEYFPEAHQRDLEATVRNSVRYSVRLSRRFNLPPSAISSSSASINGRSILSHNKSPSVVSLEFGGKRLPSGKTIGEMMVNNITAIDEAVSLEMKPPSIYSNTSGNDARSIASGVSRFGSPNSRISIAANFADSTKTSNNRYSRIELFSVDSEDENENENDEYMASYGDDNFNMNNNNQGSTNSNYTEGKDNSLNNSSSTSGVLEKSPNWLQGARIGAGSFGVVYLGMNPLTGELMAVKQVQLQQEESVKSDSHKLMIEALQHEMSLLKELNHENIVRYLGSSTEEKVLNIFLEYVPGGSVQSMLSSYGPFEEPLIRNFIRQVLIGLSYLHGENIIHRDIKGANILIDIKGTVKISDFGISKRVGNNTNESLADKGGKRTSLQGSVYWMAPEVVKQTVYTKKADIWSVGCVIIEMFTGKHPFPNFTQMQAIFKIGTHISPAIPEWCTREAKDFLNKTFEFDYEMRPNAVDLLSEPFLNTLIMSKK